MADKIIDQDKPDESLCVELVQTDKLVLPFTRPEGVPFLAAPCVFIVEDTTKDSTIKKLVLGSGLTLSEDTLTLTVTLLGSDFKCYLGQKIYAVMQVINEGKRDVIFEILIKYSPE